jgi:hypothetical protein
MCARAWKFSWNNKHGTKANENDKKKKNSQIKCKDEDEPGSNDQRKLTSRTPSCISQMKQTQSRKKIW